MNASSLVKGLCSLILVFGLGKVYASSPAEGVWYRNSFGGDLQEKLTCTQVANGGIKCQQININDPTNGTVGTYSLGQVQGNFAKRCLPRLNSLDTFNDIIGCLSLTSQFPFISSVSSSNFVNCMINFNDSTATSVINSICTNPVAAYQGHIDLGANGDLAGPSDFSLNDAQISVMPNNILWLQFHDSEFNIVPKKDEFTLRDNVPVQFMNGCFTLMLHSQTACPWYATPTDAAANTDSACYVKYDIVDVKPRQSCQ